MVVLLAAALAQIVVYFAQDAKFSSVTAPFKYNENIHCLSLIC